MPPDGPDRDERLTEVWGATTTSEPSNVEQRGELLQDLHPQRSGEDWIEGRGWLEVSGGRGDTGVETGEGQRRSDGGG